MKIVISRDQMRTHVGRKYNLSASRWASLCLMRGILAELLSEVWKSTDEEWTRKMSPLEDMLILLGDVFPDLTSLSIDAVREAMSDA